MTDGFDKATIDSTERERNRRYDSTHRQALAGQTHRAVLDAGQRLFLTRGYGRTTMRDIAQEAGVAVDSVYGHVRSKAALLSELMDRAHGGDPDVAVAERDWVREVRSAGGLGEQLDTLAGNLASVYDALAPLHLAVRRAADTDATAARIWGERSAERLSGLDGFAQHVVGLRESAIADAATVRDILYAVTSPEVYGLLVLDQSWSTERYATWLAGTLRGQLLAGQ